jgi:CheY-like chemotaxis protein
LAVMIESVPFAPSVILVAEDDELLRVYASELLEDHGYSVLEAENAERALAILNQRSDVRLVFTDVQMPGAYDGMDLSRQVHERWPHVRLIITSGRERPARSEIPNDGRFLAKPYRADELLKQVDALMSDI